MGPAEYFWLELTGHHRPRAADKVHKRIRRRGDRLSSTCKSDERNTRERRGLLSLLAPAPSYKLTIPSVPIILSHCGKR